MTRGALLALVLAAAPVAAQTADSAAVSTAAATNAEMSARYLAGVAAQPGVERSRSGLLWTVERRGSGLRPTRSDAVLATYTARLPDGTVVDASPEGAPARLPLRSVVDGLAEALQDMRPGERRTLTVPPALAYGAGGVPGPGGTFRVPPDAVLVFDVTLVRVTR